MPPRTGPRRRKRAKQAVPLPARHFTIVRGNSACDLVVAHRIELADGCLVLRDGADAIVHVVAAGQWREVGDLPVQLAGPGAVEAGSETPGQATLVSENEPVLPPGESTREPGQRFVPSSPEEAQRVLLELLHRRIAPGYQDPPDSPAVNSGKDPG